MGLPGSRWPVLLAPLAAAVAAAAVMAGPAAASGAAHTRGAASRASLARQVIAYVTAGAISATVTPILTATNTALPPIKIGPYPGPIAVTPDGKTLYVVNGPGTVTRIHTATNTALQPIKVGAFPSRSRSPRSATKTLCGPAGPSRAAQRHPHRNPSTYMDSSQPPYVNDGSASGRPTGGSISRNGVCRSWVSRSRRFGSLEQGGRDR